MTLFGRGADQQALRLFAERAERAGGALMLTGKPGSGRTTLLGDLADHRAAAGVRVIRSASAPGGVLSDHADLDRLIAPLYENLAALPAHLRESLSVAVGLDAGLQPSALSVGTAVTVLLRHAARIHPLLIVVDDLQYWDPASRALLGYACRRLGHSRVGLVVTLPAAHRHDPELAGIPVHNLEPLGTDAAEAMLRATAGDLAAGVRRRVLAAAAGNPLALAELPRALSDGRRTGREALPPVLPVTPALTTAYAPVVGSLPPGARHLLLIAALEETADLVALGRMAGEDGSLAELTAAERAGLIRVDDAGRLSFSSPLIPLTVAAAAGAVELRRAHHALAGALADRDPARALIHLARTAVHRDEALAGRLAEAAGRSLTGGDPDRAADLWMLAADLVPEAEAGRSHRHAVAVVRATALADPDGARELIGAAPDSGRSAPASAIVDVHCALRDGAGLADAHERLLATMREHHEDGWLLAEAARTASLSAWRLGRSPGDVGARPGPPELLSGAFAPATPGGNNRRQELDRVLRRIHEGHDFGVAAQASLGLAYLDRLGENRDVLKRVTDAGSSGRAVGSALPVIASWCLAAWPTGRWDRIGELAAEYSRLAARHDATDFLSPLPRLATGLLAAARGDRLAAVTAADWLARHGDQAREDVGRSLSHHVSGLLALAEGDFERAYDHLAHLGSGAPTAHLAWAALDVIEAARHSGNLDRARACADALSRLPAAQLSERMAWLVRAGHAVIAEPHTAGPLFAAVVEAPAAKRWPFDLARMHLAYSDHLNSRREAHEARFHLRQAARIFQCLGVPAWHGRVQPAPETLGRTAAVNRPAGPVPTGQRTARIARSGSPHLNRGLQPLAVIPGSPYAAPRPGSTAGPRADDAPDPSRAHHRPPSRTFVSSARDDTPILRKAR
ncbi:LuxR family transcriptional regulator [Actinoplanes italicus]|uniref:AAA ATPase-like protein n=1 Tax=Actinoplanes italicus TaxID=113567 RepID=A0A2T0K786_9ACTN|nr:AAA family ATPase [Actinoplanes italicus]PRX18883.1 AAA ATPase-like protein [Actinoplanes italicus]GIE32540.1 LuxR family transcriptional regulator [Actinoplanes italicus]